MKTRGGWLLCLAALGCGGVERPALGPSAAARLSAAASLRMEEGRWSTADALLVTALRRGELVDDLVGQASVWSNAGVLFMSRGEPERAVSAHRLAVERLASAGLVDSGASRSARTNLALALLATGEPEQAQAYLDVDSRRVAVPSAREVQEAQRQAQHRVRRARRWAREEKRSEPYFRAWEDSSRRELARGSLELGRGNATGALTAADGVLASAAAADAPGAPVPRLRSEALTVRGAALHALGQELAAVRSFEQALVLDRELGDPAVVRQTLGWLASLTHGTIAAEYFVRRARVARHLARWGDARGDLDAALPLAAAPASRRAVCAEVRLVELSAASQVLDLSTLLAAHTISPACPPQSEDVGHAP